MKLLGRKRKLTDEQLAIIRSWRSLPQLAKEWGVSKSTVNNARRHTYKSERKRA